MICPLVTIHLDEERWDRWTIYEPDVPILVLVHARPQVQRLGHFVDQLVLRVGDVYDQLRVVVVVRLPFLALWRR